MSSVTRLPVIESFSKAAGLSSCEPVESGCRRSASGPLDAGPDLYAASRSRSSNGASYLITRFGNRPTRKRPSSEHVLRPRNTHIQHEGREEESAASRCPAEPLAELSCFRGEFHSCLTARSDALFELADAVLYGDAGEVAGRAVAHETQVDHLRNFGAHPGATFQLTDDVLDSWAHPDTTGEPQWSDLSAHKRSGPIAYALACDSPTGRALARLLPRTGPLQEPQPARAAGLIEETGARAWAPAQALRPLRVIFTPTGRGRKPRPD
ncbi:polyprenyl synthetase family protein [Streptomyces sp. NPDC000410]|uniref:polyprenyl synthetase family protein n=1 Tax=Streptomyces sp. NPDC000410 TaxID=3154254 RepID=UPI00331A2A78